MTALPLSRHSWLLHCRRCGDTVRLAWPEDDFDVKVWSAFADAWAVAHRTRTSKRGDVDIVPASPDARMPWDYLPVRPCRRTDVGAPT